LVREADADRARLRPATARREAEEDASLRERQPWKAAAERDYAWLGDLITKHYGEDDSDVKVLMGGIVQAFAVRSANAGISPWSSSSTTLEANGFTTDIASGGDRDFIRPVTQEIYGIPPERVVGSSNALQ
jgi:hypothetical protein